MRLQKMFRFSFQLGAFWRERFVSGDTQRARHSRKTATTTTPEGRDSGMEELKSFRFKIVSIYF